MRYLGAASTCQLRFEQPPTVQQPSQYAVLRVRALDGKYLHGLDAQLIGDNASDMRFADPHEIQTSRHIDRGYQVAVGRKDLPVARLFRVRLRESLNPDAAG